MGIVGLYSTGYGEILEVDESLVDRYVALGWLPISGGGGGGGVTDSAVAQQVTSGAQTKGALDAAYTATVSTVATATSSATLAGDKHTPVDATSGALTMTLPTPTRIGQQVRVEKVDTSANAVTVSGTLRGAAGTIAMPFQYEVLTFVAESLSSWRVASGNKTKAALDATYGQAAPAMLTAFGQVSNTFLPPPLTAHGGGGGLNPSTTLTNGTAQRTFTPAIDGSDVRFVFWGWYANGGGNQVDLPNAVPLKLSVLINSAWVPVTFGGQISATLNPGQMLVSDPLGIDVARGVGVTTRTYYNITSGQRLPATQLTDSTSPAGGDGLVTGSDLSASGTINPSYARIFCPNQMVGTPSPGARTAAVIGDSIPSGAGESANIIYVNGASQPGFVLRGLHAGTAGGTRTSVGGERADQYLLSRARREIAVSGCGNAIVTYGRNDANALIPLATVQATLLNLWTGQARRGRRTLQTTITPATTSTDGWITAGGQGVALAGAETIRVGLNTWLRAGAPIDPTSKAAVAVGTSGALLAGAAGHPLAGVFEIADLVETARNSGIWKGASRTVADAAITTGTKTLTSATANFTTADVGLAVSVIGAGASGAVLTQAIVSVTNATTVVLNDNAGTTVSGAQAGIGVLTADGTHPTPNGHALMGTGIDTSRLAAA